MDYGIWTLLPIVVVVAVALKSRRALEPLILGTLLTYIIVDGLSFPIGWMDAFFRVATDQSHQWVFMVCGLFGALIALLGGNAAIAGSIRYLLVVLFAGCVWPLTFWWFSRLGKR